MFQLDVNGYSLSIEGSAVMIDGERLPVKLRRGLFGMGEPTLNNNVISMGKNEIIIAPAFIVVNGARFNLPKKSQEAGEDVVINGYALPKSGLVAGQGKKPRRAAPKPLERHADLIATGQNARQPSAHQSLKPRSELSFAAPKPTMPQAEGKSGNADDLGK